MKKSLYIVFCHDVQTGGKSESLLSMLMIIIILLMMAIAGLFIRMNQLQTAIINEFSTFSSEA
jgi:LPXTG-motif cell wall-anchored protein